MPRDASADAAASDTGSSDAAASDAATADAAAGDAAAGDAAAGDAAAGDAATSDACTADGQCTDGCTRVAELCNDTDDDCDGLIDEDFERGGAIFEGGPYPNDSGKIRGSPCGIGACAGGTVVCNGAGDGLTCSTLEIAAAEACDAIDDDCDGEIDEDYKGGGSVSYGGGPYAADEGTTLGDACGTGECAGGEVVCGAGETSLTCSTLAGIAADICDTADNDCDGAVDEAFVPADCDTGLPGICAAGTSTCDASGLGCVPDASPEPSEVACNGLDDDCDGETDEGSFGTTASCPAPNCAAILAAWNAPDGAYHIETPSQAASCAASTQPLFCDMDGGGWTLVMWHDGGHCQPIGPSSGWGERWFLADCNGWHTTAELMHDPALRAGASWTGDWSVSTWIDIRTMAWSELKIAGYHDPDFGGASPVLVSSSKPIPRSEFVTPFGTSGYYLQDSPSDGYYWCGGAATATCKGRTDLEGGWDFSTADVPDRWFTIDSDTSGEPNCPDNTVSTCQAGGFASCWSPDVGGARGGQAIWVR